MTRESGEVLGYRFSKPEDVAYYVLKRSDLDYYFKVAEYVVDPVRKTTREKLVQDDTTEEVSSQSAGDKRDEKDDGASADEGKESDAVGEATEDEE